MDALSVKEHMFQQQLRLWARCCDCTSWERLKQHCSTPEFATYWLAAVTAPFGKNLTQQCGTPEFAAPEITTGKRLGLQVTACFKECSCTGLTQQMLASESLEAWVKALLEVTSRMEASGLHDRSGGCDLWVACVPRGALLHESHGGMLLQELTCT
eukprot:scaffold187776_cov16-Tisochrysis_lutea.AAC.1